MYGVAGWLGFPDDVIVMLLALDHAMRNGSQ